MWQLYAVNHLVLEDLPTTRQLVMCFLGIYILLCCVAAGDEQEQKMLMATEGIVSQLVSMRFNYPHCQKAAIKSSNAGVEEAMNWLISHMDDPGFPTQPLSLQMFIYLFT